MLFFSFAQWFFFLFRDEPLLAWRDPPDCFLLAEGHEETINLSLMAVERRMRKRKGLEKRRQVRQIGEAARHSSSSRFFIFSHLDLLFLSLKTPSSQAAPNNLAHRAQGAPAPSAAASGDPEAAPSYGYGDLDASRGKLHKGAAALSAHSHSHFGSLPPALDAHSLEKLKHQAMAKARAVQSSLIAAVKSGTGAASASNHGSSSSSHGGFGVVVAGAAGASSSSLSAAAAPAAPATAFLAFSAKLGRLCDKVESSRATALACR